MIKTIYREEASSGTTHVERYSCTDKPEYSIRVTGKELCGFAGGHRCPMNITEAEARDLYNCLHEFFGEKKA
jgi:hypothetical protein